MLLIINAFILSNEFYDIGTTTILIEALVILLYKVSQTNSPSIVEEPCLYRYFGRWAFSKEKGRDSLKT